MRIAAHRGERAKHLPLGSTRGSKRLEKGRDFAASAKHLGWFGGPANYPRVIHKILDPKR
jgi:hypothetical protein